MTLSPNEQQELEIQKSLNHYIDTFTNFRFNAGAGAGKTYALVESIKYILKTKIKTLTQKGQQFICITYTNVAVNEIKERLGTSGTILISTIHERLWELIKTYQKELIAIHSENIKIQIENINATLLDTEHSTFGKHARLSEEQQTELAEILLVLKDVFYKNIDSSAPNFRQAINNHQENMPDFLTSILSNVGDFKDIAKKVYKKKRYQECLGRINRGEEENIEYDSNSNSDRLEYMRFSHDTLLKYSAEIIEKYRTLKRIIIDKYPYILIDEYQDTNKLVVKIMKSLSDYSEEINKEWLVGYFGDTTQNIYDDGVGLEIKTLHENVENLNKVFNRRSHIQIIDVINVIRDDEIKQEPMFNDRTSGSVSFTYINCLNEDEKIEKSLEFLTNFQNEINNTKDSKIHCLVLTNKLMAQMSEFGDIYKIVSRAKAIYWNELSSKFLSHDLDKLHPTILLTYKIISLYNLIHQEGVTYYQLYGPLKNKISFSAIHETTVNLKSISAEKFEDWLEGLSQFLDSRDLNSTLRTGLLNFLTIKTKDLERFDNLSSLFNFELNKLMYKNREREGTNEQHPPEIKDFLDISLTQWNLWIGFINKREDEDIVYHTYHGTKGEEYENVAIIMEEKFGKDSTKFKDFFEHMQLDSEEQNLRLESLEYKERFEQTKNLIYVACSRAITNLRVLYLDETNEIAKGIESIFGPISA